MTQVNPLAETKEGELVAADAKLGFDDNAAFRQKEIFAMRDSSQEDPRSASSMVQDHRLLNGAAILQSLSANTAVPLSSFACASAVAARAEGCSLCH